MNDEKFIEFSKKLKKIASNFEETAWTDNLKLLKKDFEIKNVESPQYYLNVIDDLKETSRQAMLLFILSVLDKVCIEDEKIYSFDYPYQANLLYNGVFKKEGTFYLVEEDGTFRDVFVSDNFVQFLDDHYNELYDNDAIF